MNEKELFNSVKTIAVVGISDKEDRSSFGVAKYLERYFKIIPINPNLSQWQGKKCYPSLLDVPLEENIDLVDVFRRSEDVLPIAHDTVTRGGVKCLWLQQGIINNEAKKLGEENGIEVIMDSCLAVVHAAYARA